MTGKVKLSSFLELSLGIKVDLLLVGPGSSLLIADASVTLAAHGRRFYFLFNLLALYRLQVRDT